MRWQKTWLEISMGGLRRSKGVSMRDAIGRSCCELCIGWSSHDLGDGQPLYRAKGSRSGGRGDEMRIGGACRSSHRSLTLGRLSRFFCGFSAEIDLHLCDTRTSHV
jgi:hypothetical protein